MLHKITLKASGLLVFFLISCWVQAQVNPTHKQDLRFVFMTDIHIQPGVEEQFKKALEKALSLNPDFIITGGDLIMDALGVRKPKADSLYLLYSKIIEPIPVPIYNTLGNHDIWGWGYNQADTLDSDYGYGMYRKYLGDPFQFFSFKGIYFLIVPSVIYKKESVYIGGITEETLNKLKSNLLSIPQDAPLVLISHIPLVTAETQWEEGALVPNHPMNVMGNSEDLIKILSKYNLKLILQGHLHIFEKIEIAGVKIATGGAVSGKWWEGTYKKTYPGFLLVDFLDDRISLNYIEY